MFALEDFHNGKDVLPEGEPKSFTLFTKNGWGKKALSINRGGSTPPTRIAPATKKKVKDNKVRTMTKTNRYFGVPDDVIAELKQISDKSGFPYWSVTDMFIRYSIAMYEAGEFRLNPQPRVK